MVRVHGNALKHGLTSDEVAYAWENLAADVRYLVRLWESILARYRLKSKGSALLYPAALDFGRLASRREVCRADWIHGYRRRLVRVPRDGAADEEVQA